MNEQEKTLVDHALDLCVYVPLGMALEARDLLPKLAERGRGQVALTRLAGRVAAQRAETARTAGAARRTPPPTDADREVPIEGYDDLSAPNILPVLDDLSADELDDVLSYEQRHRARATVINRIRQLQA